MYARSMGTGRQRSGRSVHIAAPRQNTIVPPPNYSGTAIAPVKESGPPAGQTFEELFRDGSREEHMEVSAESIPELPEAGQPMGAEEPRYPLYEQKEEPSDPPMQPWITRRREMPGLGGLLPAVWAADDLLLAALIILLLANGSDEITILLLAFLLMVK